MGAHMTFDNSVMNLTHLITFPSVWLPDPPCVRVLLAGATDPQVEQLVTQAHEVSPNTNWAFYLVPDADLTNSEHVDWMLINRHHVHGSLVYVNDLSHLIWHTALPSSHVVHASDATTVTKLLNKPLTTTQTALECIYSQFCQQELSQ